MKLRNKKTGEIGWLYEHSLVQDIIIVYDVKGIVGKYTSLAELNEEWEDYEEPKSINEIDVVLDAIGEYCNNHSYYSGDLEKIKILNTVEEKLKAFKRLKDNGMIKYSFHREKRGIDLDFYTLTILAPRDKDSLDLLFGGEG